MRINEIDFGSIDARNSFLAEGSHAHSLEKVFVNPFGVNIDDYISGRKCFIFGIKGSGKSTLLRIVRERVNNKGSMTEFVYFSDQVPSSKARTNGPISSISFESMSDVDLDTDFWRSFFLLSIAKHVSFNCTGSAVKKFLKFVYEEATGNKGTFWGIVSKVPDFQNWSASIKGSYGGVSLDGKFRDVKNISGFFDSSFSLLSDVHFRSSLYIFVDELEISFSTGEAFARDLLGAASLIKTVRDMNEIFRSQNIPIFLVCAVRKEVSQKILGNEAAKIVRDLGFELSWQRPAWSTTYANYFHPLFEIILRRIFHSKHPKASHASWNDLAAIEREFFNFNTEAWSQKWVLDLTTYRPRDIPILFDFVKQHDGPKTHFSKETFSRLIRKNYRDGLWVDFSEALVTEYTEEEVDLFRKIFFGLPSYFRLEDFVRKADDFSGDPDVADLIDSIDQRRWVKILKDLYELGAVGWAELEGDEERVHFHFRGDTTGLQVSRTNYIVKVLVFAT